MPKYFLLCLICVLVAACNTQPAPTAEIQQSPIAKTTLTTAPTTTPTVGITATPRPVTPIASPTPTTTSTPTLYTIQPGDTLLDVAIQFDLSVEAIQDANGIVDPRFLQIGQELVIPPPDAATEAPAAPTATPFPVNINAVNFIKTDHATLWGLGEVTNPGDVPLTEVVIEAALFDGGGVLLAREAAYTQLDVILPGQAVPFSILFETPPDEFAQYKVTAVSGVPLSNQTRYYFDMEIFDATGSPDGLSTYRLTGKLRNTGPIDAELIRLVAVLYNADDQILAQRQAQLAVTVLKAGAVTDFDLEVIAPRGVVDHYQLLAQGLQAQ